MINGYMYILLCANEQYYTGSTKKIERRVRRHESGNGANFTKKNLPLELVYVEEFMRIDTAFYREKQVQRWSHGKKKALVDRNIERLKNLAACQNDSYYENRRD